MIKIIMHLSNPSGNEDVVESPFSEDIRDFKEFWESKLISDALPHRRAFDFYNLVQWIGSVLIMDVLNEGEDFRYRLVGTKIVEAVGRDLTGKKISEVEYDGNRENVLQTFRLPVKERKPVIRRGKMIWIHDKSWRNYESVHCPLMSDAGDINMTIGVQVYPRKY